MTIAQVIHSHTVGGAERHVMDLSRALAERGHRVYLICPNRGWLWDAARGTEVTPFHAAMDGLLDLSSVGRIARFARRVEADVLHAHLTRGAFYAVKAGRRAGIPIVATAHATHTWKHFGGADRVLCVSRAVRENLLRHGLPEDRLTVVYNGVPFPPDAPDPVRIAALRAEWGAPDGARVVGMLARLISDKGPDLLLDVAARWKRDRPDVHFVLAGPAEREMRRQLTARVAAAGLKETVSLPGPTPDPLAVLAAFDVLAVPSRREAFPLAPLEAMSMRVPVVAARVGGLPEMIRDGENGYLTPPDDVDALGAALARALDPPERAGVVEAAYRRVGECFTRDQMVSEIEARYQEVAR